MWSPTWPCRRGACLHSARKCYSPARMNWLRVRSTGLVVVLGLGAAGVLYALHHHYPITEWLIWRYIGYFALCGAWAAACLGAGLRLFDSLRLDHAQRDERWVLGFALGVLAFGLSMFALGFLKLWSGWTFFLLPAVFVRFGRRELREALGALKAWLNRSVSDRRLVALLVTIAGTIGLILVYVPTLHLKNMGYDSRWYHLVVAEQYAVRGGIEAFTEGWLNGTQPQFSSMLYGWAFLLPGTLYDQVALSFHVELTIFIATLASVPPLARVLTGEPQPFAWVFVLLFPGLYLYDSSLISAADHIVAFWAVPVALAAYLAWRDFSVRSVVLASLMASGPLLTKYTAISLVLGPGLLLLGRAAYLLVRRNGNRPAQSRSSVIAALGAGLATGLVATSPHWLKNLVYHGDPLFPFLRSVFPAHPLVDNLADRFASGQGPWVWQPERSMRGVLETLAAPFNFAFNPHDWHRFHGHVPVFGFLYTVTMPAVLFVQKRARIITMYVVITIGLLFWYWTFHQDRYLQAFVPWMAACVAAIVSQAWRVSRPARAAVVILILAQIIVGAGVPFLPTHHRSPFAIAIDHMGAWRSPNKRMDLESPFRPYSDINGRLPEDAKLLIHDMHLTLGMRYPMVTDAVSWQTGIDYALTPRPSDVWSLFRSHGVTHVAWNKRVGKWHSSIAEDVAFLYFVTNHLEDVQSISDLAFGALPKEVPSDAGFGGKVAVLGCEKTYEDGIYPIEALTASWLSGRPPKEEQPKPQVPIDRKAPRAELEPLLADADAWWIEQSCFAEPRGAARLGFRKAQTRDRAVTYVRTQSARRRAPAVD